MVAYGIKNVKVPKNSKINIKFKKSFLLLILNCFKKLNKILFVFKGTVVGLYHIYLDYYKTRLL